MVVTAEERRVPSSAKLPALAFYYPNPFWYQSNWAKNVLLFFDGIALLLPDYMRGRLADWDKDVAPVLLDRGLLHVLEPERFIDKAAAAAFAKTMIEIIGSGALDSLATKGAPLHELSYSRLGGMADAEVAKQIHEELKKRGLATDTEDGLSVPIHHLVRSLILVLWAQILRPSGRDRGLELWPATDRPEIHAALRALLGLPEMPSAGHVVSLDLATVGVDLSKVPIDEVISFRTENWSRYSKYAKDVRAFVDQMSKRGVDEHHATMRERRADIREEAALLRRAAQKAWRTPAAFALGMVAAVWKAAAGDPITALLAVGGGAMGVTSNDVDVGASAYSYLFLAREGFTGSAWRRFLTGVRNPKRKRHTEKG
jgi:hypothetical protein